MRSLLLASALLALPLAGCGADQSPDEVVDAEDIAEQAAAEASATIEGVDIDGASLSTSGPEGIVDVVTTTDGAIELGIAEGALFTRLSEATRRQVADEMERETEDQEGLGGTIARAVTGAVAEGLATTVSIPLEDIADIRYEDGRVVIEMVDGGDPPLGTAKTNGRPLLESFDAEAGARLADAFDKATR